MNKLRVGLIGCGGRQNAHIKSLLQLPDVKVVALAEPVEQRREAAAQATGATRLYENHKALFEKEDASTLDALFIAVEPTAHTDIEETAVAKGIPFLVEKPMTLNLAQADALAAQIRKKNLITAVGFQDRYLDLMEQVRTVLEEEKPTGCLVNGAWIGGIPGVWWWQKKSTCGGQLVEQNIHLADGLRWLFGDPLSVYAVNGRGIVVPGKTASAEYDTDDYSVCIYRFANQVTATLESACYSRSVRPNCGLVIKLPDVIIDYRLRNNLILTRAGSTTDTPRKNDQTYDLDRNFLLAVRNNDPSLIRSPYADALRSLKMTMGANRSMETGEVVRFDAECNFS